MLEINLPPPPMVRLIEYGRKLAENTSSSGKIKLLTAAMKKKLFLRL